MACIGVAAACAAAPRHAWAQRLDPLEGVVVGDIRVSALRDESGDIVERHLVTRVGQPFRRANLAADRRQLDELRLFTSVTVEPRLENEAVVLDIAVLETLRVLPAVAIRVTDENGISAGPGARAVSLFGGGAQFGVSLRFGGETAFGTAIDSTTITPGTVAWHLGLSHSTRENEVYAFEEEATTVDVRLARNWRHGLRTGVAGNVTTLDAGASGATLSPDGRDVIPALGGFVAVDRLDSSTDPRAGIWAEIQVDRLLGDARSWTTTLDVRGYQPLSDRHGLSVFALATVQTGEVGVDLPEYLQFALGGGNSVRGWSLGARRGRSQFIGTVEYTWVARPVTPFSVAGLNLYGGLQVVGFADVGAAWTGDAGSTPRSAIDGYGLGLRLLVPFVDVIRLDVAWGEPGRGASAYFGVALKAARQRQRVR